MRPGWIESAARHLGGTVGGTVIGFGISAIIDPTLVAHHWSTISEGVANTIISSGSGIAGHLSAGAVNRWRSKTAEDSKRQQLRKKAIGLAKQIATIPNTTERERLTELLNRRLGDWESDVIASSTFEASLRDISKRLFGRDRRTAAAGREVRFFATLRIV
jgi:hypothetical protein